MNIRSWLCAGLLSLCASQAFAATEADLSATITNASATSTAGGQSTYTVTVTNNGPDAATNASLTIPLPAALTYQSITSGGWSCTTPPIGMSGYVSCSASSFNPGSATFTLVTNLSPSATGSLTLTATVGSSNDPNLANNSASDIDTIVPASPAPVPTLSEWAMILLASLLAGGAALSLGRRRPA